MGTEHLLENCRRWVQALENLGTSHVRLQTRGLQIALVVVACLTAYLGGLITVENQGMGPVALLLFAVTALATVALYACLRSGTISPAIVWCMHACVLITLVAGTIRNGVGPLVLASSAIVLSHALLAYRQALWFAVLLIFSLVCALLLHHAPDPVITPRALAAMVTTLCFMQLGSRYWAAWGKRAADISRELQTAVETLDERRRLSEAQLDDLRLLDGESGLPNARGFAQQAQRLMGSSRPPLRGMLVSLRMLDWVDGCARHPEEVSRRMVENLVSRLQGCFGPGALIGRTAPEEFEVLVMTTGQSGEPFELSHPVAPHVLTLERPYVVSAAVVVSTPRLGISLWPQHAENISDLLAKARQARDVAVHRALALPVTFDEKVVAQTATDSALVSELVQSLQDGDFELMWQPILDFEGQPLRKAEALLRWRHPRRGLLMPASFIPLAEQSRLVFDLTEWVIGQASAQVKRWRNGLHPEFQVNVNVPAAWLVRCAEQPQAMVERLTALGIPPQSVVLEITEGSLLEVTADIRKVMMLLKGLGLQIALDDFGVGYSSFGQLEKLDIDFLKLDKTFVDDLDLKPSRRAICEAVVTMAHHLGARVVAEGVERVEQLEWLEAIGVDWYQGYLVARPMPSSSLESWVSARAVNIAAAPLLQGHGPGQPAWLQ